MGLTSIHRVDMNPCKPEGLVGGLEDLGLTGGFAHFAPTKVRATWLRGFLNITTSSPLKNWKINIMNISSPFFKWFYYGIVASCYAKGFNRVFCMGRYTYYILYSLYIDMFQHAAMCYWKILLTVSEIRLPALKQHSPWKLVVGRQLFFWKAISWGCYVSFPKGNHLRLVVYT